MRVLFVHPAAEMSVSDVSRGYKAALTRQGHDIREYHLGRRFAYHRAAMNGVATPEAANDMALLSRQASENIVVEALYHQADIVIMVSGLNLHPVALWLLGKANIPAAVIFTESPYNDESQLQWSNLTQVNSTVDLTIFTNDKYSSIKHGWNLLEPSFDPDVHHPVEPHEDEKCDVIMIGTGWGERQAFLEAVDWTGIDLKIMGIWPAMNSDSPLFPYYHELVVNNEHIAPLYCGAKVCINFHRRDQMAMSPGPRAYEIAACGAFQISDPRPGVVELFGDSVPTFDTPERLGELVRYYTQHEDERVQRALESLRRVRGQTFDSRAAELVAALSTNSAQLQGV